MSRRSSSKLSNKRVEIGSETVHILSSDGQSQDEADAGEIEEVDLNNKDLQAALDKARKPDLWPSQFAKAVQARQQAIVTRLKEIRERSAADKQAFDAEIAPLIASALGGLMDDDSDPASFTFPIQVQYLGPENQPYCEAMSSLMAHSGTLLLAYDELARRDTHKSRLQDIAVSFNKDKGAMEATIEAGKKVAAIDIERLLVDRFNEVRLPNSLTGEDEHKGRLLLSKGTEKETQSKQSLGWGNVATDTERAVNELCYAGEPEDGGR